MPTLHQALSDSEVSSTYSMFPKKEYIQGEEMKNEQINITASTEMQSDIWAKTSIKMKEWEIKIKDLIQPALLFRLSDSLACILSLHDILLPIHLELKNFTFLSINMWHGLLCSIYLWSNMYVFTFQIIYILKVKFIYLNSI